MSQYVFLDTNFIIATQLKDHIFYKNTKNLRAQFLEKDLKPTIHSIIFDEFWYVLIGLWKSEYGNKKDSLLQKNLRDATNSVLAFKNINVLKTILDKNDLLKSLNYVKKYKMKPRDAMILTIIRKEKITKIASFDNDFDSISKLKRIY